MKIFITLALLIAVTLGVLGFIITSDEKLNSLLKDNAVYYHNDSDKAAATGSGDYLDVDAHLYEEHLLPSDDFPSKPGQNSSSEEGEESEEEVKSNQPSKKQSLSSAPLKYPEKKLTVKSAEKLKFKDGIPRVSIVIDDVGINIPHSKKVFSLDGDITVSILAYANDINRWVSLAENKGFDVMLHLPMQPQSKTINPGPQVLKSEYGRDAINNITNQALSKFEKINKKPIAINNHMGSSFTENYQAMGYFFDYISEVNMLFLDSLTSINSVATRVADEKNMQILVRDVFLDNVRTEASIIKKLKETEGIAKKKGWAIAIGHPYPATINALAKWFPEAKKRGIKIVLISELINNLQGDNNKDKDNDNNEDNNRDYLQDKKLSLHD